MKSIPLSNSIQHALIDDEDYIKVIKYNWQLLSKCVGSRIDGDTVALGRFLLDLKKGDGILVDHEDRNILNNQKHNLRKSNKSLNAANKEIKPREVCSYKGVYPARDKWRARIKVNNTQINLGTFKSQIGAARAYNQAALKYFGKFAVLNEIT